MNGKANVGILGRYKLDMESNAKILEKILEGDSKIETSMLSYLDNTKGEYKKDFIPFEQFENNFKKLIEHCLRKLNI